MLRGFHAGRWTLAVKVLLLLLFVVASNDGAWERLQALGSPVHASVFLALWGVSAAALFCVAFLPHRPMRYLWTLVFAVCSLVALSYSLVTRSPLGLADMEQLLQALAFAGDAMEFYAGPLLLASLVCAIGIVALNMPPYWRAGRQRRRLAAMLLLPFVPVAGTAGVLYARGGHGTDGLPVQFTSSAFAVVLGLERLLSDAAERRPVAIAALEKPRARTVVVIMDESVRGDLLDINRPGGIRSGLLPHADAMANFGVMSSIANCSASTNAAFRFGVGRGNYLEELKTNPSIWRYARQAGYRSVYIDAQRHNGGLMNLMTAEERAEIDEHIQLPPATRPMDRDIEVARRLRRIVEQATIPTFVYVNKMGAHFPYEGKYPAERRTYEPVMERNYFGTEVDPKIGLPQNEDPETRLRFRNSYLNAVAWNVGGFFDALLPGLDLANAVVLYMADHGQNLHERDEPGYLTHCVTSGASPEEGMVPMVVLTRIPALLAAMRRAAEKNRDRVSQFNVFPTVLALLGYRAEDIARSATGELPLEAELPAGQRRFLSRFFVRLGRSPIWNSLDTEPEAP